MKKNMPGKTKEIEAVRQQLNAAVNRHACLLDPEILHLSRSLDLLLNHCWSKTSGEAASLVDGKKKGPSQNETDPPFRAD